MDRTNIDSLARIKNESPNTPVIIGFERNVSGNRRDVYISVYVHEANYHSLTLGMAPVSVRGPYPKLTFDCNVLKDDFKVLGDEAFQKVKEAGDLQEWANEEAMVRLLMRPRQMGDPSAINLVGRFYGIVKKKDPPKGDTYLACLGVLREQDITLHFSPKISPEKYPEKRGERLEQRYDLANRSGLGALDAAVEAPFYDFKGDLKNRKFFNLEKICI